MQKVFVYNNGTGQIELNIPEIILIDEFHALMDNKRNVCKEDPEGIQHLRAFREFTYIWLAIDWLSLYNDYSNQERHQEALRDSQLTEEEFNDPIFRAACRKYRELQNSTRSIKLLQGKVLEELKILTDQVKKDTQAESKIRAGATEGYTPNF